jgi:integrase
MNTGERAAIAHSGGTESAKKTWDDAVVRWQKERAWRADESIRRERNLFDAADDLLQGRELDTIRRADLEKLRDRKIAAGRSARTANYLVQAVRAVLRAAVRWEWTESAPALERLREDARPDTSLSIDQAFRLLPQLPLHLRRMAIFSLETGLRQGNAKRLEWRHVQWSLNRLYFPAGEMKSKQALCVPLSPLALSILRECLGDHPRWAFTYLGRQIKQPSNTAWYRTLRSLGLQGTRWHDLRHSWASWHMTAGTDALVLQKLGGWKTLAMVSRYAHLNDRAGQAAVAVLSEFVAGERQAADAARRVNG